MEDQPFENQFGRPIAVRTDSENNIYVADRASQTIKVFDRDGNYIHSLGGRGMGPGEFQKMELMEWTPEVNLVIMDRGNMQYTVISTEEEYLESRFLPGAALIRSGGEPHMGRVLSINLGIFIGDDGNLVHFFGTRRKNEEFTEESGFHFLDMYVQVLNPEGETLHYDLLTTIHERLFSRTKSFINWQDEGGNYYLIEHVEDIPVIRRFTLQFE